MSRDELEEIVSDEEDARTMKKKAREEPDALRMLFLSDRKMAEYDDNQSTDDDFSWVVVSPREGGGMMSYDAELTVEKANRQSSRPRGSSRRRGRRYSDEY